jgi:hypothetical protein
MMFEDNILIQVPHENATALAKDIPEKQSQYFDYTVKADDDSNISGFALKVWIDYNFFTI